MGGWQGTPHAPAGARSGRDLLDALGPMLDPARAVRYQSPTSFDGVSVDELDAAARSLKAIAYSCQEGARLLERVRDRRRPSEPSSAAGEPGSPAGEVTESPEATVTDLLAALEESVNEARAARDRHES